MIWPDRLQPGDAILLLEDTREAPYRIDRMLQQLQLAGKLETVRGAVLGQLPYCYQSSRASCSVARTVASGCRSLIMVARSPSTRTSAGRPWSL